MQHCGLINISQSYYGASPEYVGVIAQEVQEVAPYMVHEVMIQKKGFETDTVLSVDPSAFTYILINAVKELKQENEALKRELKEMREELVGLRQQLKQLNGSSK